MTKRFLANLRAYRRLCGEKNIAKSFEFGAISDEGIPVIEVTFDVESGDWILLKEVGIRSETVDTLIVIPKGFRYDLASIPTPFHSIINVFELSLVAPLVHDYLYRYKGELPSGQYFTRKEADKIFLELMRKEGVSKTRSRVAYLAVRWFGPKKWKPPY